MSIAAAFVASFLMVAMFDYRTPEQKAEAKQRAADYAAEKAAARGQAFVDPAIEGETAVETEVRAAETTTTVGSPLSGHVVSLDESGDPVSASRALGEGVAIRPTDSTVVAPVSGVLSTVAETGHAFGIKTDDGNQHHGLGFGHSEGGYRCEGR